ncbi:UDPglucose 6-dehydrogenase [Allopseudospirillum japonicum]|uniref:UDP-glucose 6-dehydrogenase n=1 Tax=Allopseudospirillum japonicum TaxID=64971 RepID=A0A1H6TGN0_9GAMM|nr:nucleotide sugar dehydrogenase [Allopseudospirillum japonicum]SEI74932.1 UDPglucose 6-dehydrogenase [Allopseudospirillum japonicum]
MQIAIYGNTLSAQVSAAAFATTGNQVLHLVPENLGIQLQKHGPETKELALKQAYQEQQASGRLQVMPLSAGLKLGFDVFILALASDQVAQANAVTKVLASLPQKQLLVINQSTFAVGTSARLQQILTPYTEEASQKAVVSLPDLLQEGAALTGFMRPARIILGCEQAWALKQIQALLYPFNRRQDQLQIMSTRDAELTKLAITGMLATRLSYINELANLADQLQVDIENVRQGMGGDSRIGFEYLYPGCGFGGLNFARDLDALTQALDTYGQNTTLLHQVLSINESQKEILFRKLWQYYQTQLQDRKVAIWGAAFKPGTDSLDKAPILALLAALWAQGVKVRVHDPKALDALQNLYPDHPLLECHSDPYQALQEADALLVVTEWKCYWTPDFPQMRELMRHPLILDGRNIYDPEYVKHLGFIYFGVGRGETIKNRVLYE